MAVTDAEKRQMLEAQVAELERAEYGVEVAIERARARGAAAGGAEAEAAKANEAQLRDQLKASAAERKALEAMLGKLPKAGGE